MNTTYQVTSTTGQLLGIFPKDGLAAVKALVDANPGATVKPVVTYTPCAKHPAFEPHNCPACGTARIMGN